MKNQLSPEVLQNIRLVATDMDGTLTQKGKLTSGLISYRTVSYQIATTR